MTVILYRRISDKDKQGDGFSLDAQEEVGQEYARRHGWQVARVFTDKQTAKSPGRERFTEMVEWIRAQKKPVVLLVEKTDRLYRNFRDHLTIDDLINQFALEVHLYKEGEILGKNASSHTKFVHGIKTLLAKQYIDNLSEEVRKGQRQKVMEGGWSWPAPYGYQNQARALVPHPDRAAFVREAFRLYATGLYSIETCISQLHARGFIYRPNAPKIGKTKLNQLLKSRVYIGEIEYQGEVYPGKHEPLVDRSTWRQVQSALRKGSKPMRVEKAEFLYRGFLTCGECGQALVGEAKKGGKYIYYRCIDMKRTCHQGYIRESVIDEAMAATFNRLPLTEHLQEYILQAARELDALEENTYDEEAERLDREIRKTRGYLKKAYQDRLDGVIDDEMWRDVSEAYRDQIALLEEQRGQLHRAEVDYMQTAIRLLELPKRLRRSWLGATVEEKKVFLGMLTSNFIVMDGNAHVEIKEALSYFQDRASCSEWRPTREEIRTFLRSHSVTIHEMAGMLTA